MKAVLLDTNRFIEGLALPAPEKVTEYVTFESTPQDSDIIIERCHDADIMITGSLRIEDTVIAALPKLKLIQATSAGTNTIDKEACKKHGVELYSAGGFAVKSVPEHTLMLMLMGMRAATYYHNAVINGDWQQQQMASLAQMPLFDLEGKTLGIIGVGSIGKRVTELARAFKMTVLWAEHQGEEPRNEDYTDFDTLLAASDVISLHVPLTADTKHLIDEKTIAKMTKKPLVVNAARGAIVDSKAMADAIGKGNVLGYATDVFEREPVVESDPLLKLAEQAHPRLIFSPHVAAGSQQAHHAVWDIVTQQINDFIEKHS